MENVLQTTKGYVMDLSKFSNFAIARSLMQLLWNMYDAGGISCHRSERSSLLESITDCTDIELRFENVGADALLAEAQKRSIPERDFEFELEMFDDLHLMSFGQYMCLVLEELRLYYAQDLMKEIGDGWFVSLTEKRVVDAIVRLLGVEQGAAQLKALGHIYTPRELTTEGRQRSHDYINQKYSLSE